MRSTLDTRLLAAHAAGDQRALVTLYREAADSASAPEARGFYLTHAYVYALERNDPMIAELHSLLCALGREE